MADPIPAAGTTGPDESTDPVGPDAALVDFCGEQHHLEPGRSLTFGRAADLVIDENPFLHRRLGLIEHHLGLWWLRNIGSRLPMTVNDVTSRSQVILAPGRELALSFPIAAVQFGAGRGNYELEITLARSPTVPGRDVATEADPEGETVSLADIALTPDQKRLIVALAEPALLAGTATVALPANNAVAHRLGWTVTRFNRKLDNVCERLTKVGVSGLRGRVGEAAGDRRLRLVEHAIHSGLVDLDDLALLPHRHDIASAPKGFTPASSG